MKTKLLFTLFLFSAFVGNSFSQTYIPMLNNSTWNIVVAGFLGSQNYPVSPGINSVIGAYTYVRYMDPTNGVEVFLREDVAARKVYKNIGGIDHLLYDFNLETSSTITLESGFTYSVTVDEVSVVGGTRKRISLYNFIAPTETWIEGVGSNRHPFRPTYELLSDPYIYTTCSAQNGTNIYNHGLANGQTTPTDCSMLLSVNEVEYLQNKVSFTPNPFKTGLTISRKSDFQNATLQIFNSVGKLVKVVSDINGSDITIQRENLPAGMYFAELNENGKSVSVNKIIISD